MAYITSSPTSQQSAHVSRTMSGVCSWSAGGGEEEGVEKFCVDVESLLQFPEKTYSDAIINVEGRRVSVHRCILAVRCPFFQTVFANAEKDADAKVEVDLSGLIKEGRVGYEAFMAVMGYLYAGRVKSLASVVACMDPTCSHLTCYPAIEFFLDLLCASSVLDIPELKALGQQHLMNLVDKAQVDDVLQILKSSCTQRNSQLEALCLQKVAASDLDSLGLEKELSETAVWEVRELRLKLGLAGSEMDELEEKHCKRIHRALDSDDVELVQLLLKEGNLSLDGANALHYAATYCDPKTMAELLELEVADTNLRNRRGLTVLHVAAMRREPQIIVALLAKGAGLHDLTPDGRTALQISRRLGKKSDCEGEECEKDRLCIAILEQRERKHPFSKFTTDVLALPLSSEKDLWTTLLYLENRVALARLLFPREAKIVMGLSHLDSTSEITRVDSGSPMSGLTSSSSKPSVGLPCVQGRKLAGEFWNVVGTSKETSTEPLVQRVNALRTTVELGHRFFPHCAAVIDKYVADDDILDLSEKANSEEQLTKKRRYAELKEILAQAFLKDVADMHKNKALSKSDVPVSTSSTSLSKALSSTLVTRI